jgi:hypothetical protein
MFVMQKSRVFVVVLILFGVLLGGSATSGAEPKPFAKYPSQSTEYLKRLHAGGAASEKGSLQYRPDFPDQFSGWQKAGRVELAKLLGLERIRQAAKKHQAVVKLGEVKQEAGYTRQRGEIETEPGVKIPFWLLRPDGKKEPGAKLPLVICAHGHDSDGWNTYAGVYRDAAHRRSTLAKDGDPGVQAVRLGYVALIPATRGLAKVAQIPDIKNRHGGRACRAQLIHCLLAGRTAVGERVWDTQRLLDWAMAGLKGIDKKKVVLLGNSGGGVLTVYAAALDERIAVSVPSCSFTSFTSSSGFVFHCDCCLVPGAQSALGDMADIGGLTAPRPLLAVHGRKDALHSSVAVEKAMARVSLIYKAADASKQFRFQWGAQGHKFYPKIMWPFIEAALESK